MGPQCVNYEKKANNSSQLADCQPAWNIACHGTHHMEMGHMGHTTNGCGAPTFPHGPMMSQ